MTQLRRIAIGFGVGIGFGALFFGACALGAHAINALIAAFGPTAAAVTFLTVGFGIGGALMATGFGPSSPTPTPKD